jgi:phosphatidylglycerophosphate synthase
MSMPEPQDTQYGRPLLIEERTNRYIIHPLSAVVEKYAIRWGVSANIVSFLGLGCGLLAGLLYYYQDYRLYVLGGFLFMCLWHVFDGADGRIARATGTSSAFGRIIDGMCDHVVFGAVYFAFVFFALKNGASPWVWGLGILAALSHGIQSAGYEERRQKYQRRFKGTGRDQVNASLLTVKGKSSAIARIYDKIQTLVSGGESPLESALETYRTSPTPQTSPTDIVKSTAKIVKAWSLLNANNRTIMIAVFALFGQPLLYLMYEIIVLNIVLIGLIIYERYAERRIASHALSELSVS